jgi:CBS domain-containing protein
MARSTVEQVMTPKVVTAGLDMPYKRLVELLAGHRISAVPVVSDAGRVLGVVSEADLLLKPGRPDQPEPPLHAAFRRGRELRRKADALCARDLMTSPAVTVPPTAPIAEAARIMHHHHVKSVPVLDEAGRLVGIASRVDLLRVFLRDDVALQDLILCDVFERSLLVDIATVQVAVEGGVVTLRGRLDRRSEVDLAGRLTATVDGVVAVSNQLTFAHDDARHDSYVRPNW